MEMISIASLGHATTWADDSERASRLSTMLVLTTISSELTRVCWSSVIKRGEGLKDYVEAVPSLDISMIFIPL